MNSEARVLITGCGGMLGDAMYRTFADGYQHVHATDIVLNEPWLSRLDVRELDECERAFAEVEPTIVLHLAALTDLEYCETHQDDCWKTNALGVENVALLARLGVSNERAAALAREVNSILDHMEALARVDTANVPEYSAFEKGQRLRPDAGPPIPLARGVDKLAPEARESLILVPRLATHEDAGE